MHTFLVYQKCAKALCCENELPNKMYQKCDKTLGSDGSIKILVNVRLVPKPKRNQISLGMLYLVSVSVLYKMESKSISSIKLE